MANVYFQSLDQGDLILVEFLTTEGGIRPMTMLVDSGYCGQSSFVVPSNERSIFLAPAGVGYTSGAIIGNQERGLVICRVPQVVYEETMIAIFADTTSLSLPGPAEGLVGLRFLRQFNRWGAERTSEKTWRFFLSTDS
ncbi:MAG: hypothetical protein O2857_27350 [Planctomycetota bacterium]|nr:hypothetical protein [Planctomycetota bacterium]